mmetsp:Transcript_16661/g.24480  ORF Transcript_16661/g.24480 Transcript_16661/m.24480 type:complete len:327 (+) Transcript_16661:620-1600(+)
MNILKSTIFLQSIFRRELTHKKNLQCYEAARCIQCIWRSSRARRHHKVLLSSVVLIQSLARSRRQQMMFAKFKRATIMIQSIVRSVQKQAVFSNYCKAGTLIQKHWRGARYRLAYSNLRSCSIMLQSLIRCRQKYLRYIILMKGVISLQSLFRGILSRTKISHYRVRSDAITLQSHVHGTLARNNLYKRHLAARCIQTLWRKLATQADFIVYRSSTIAAQSLARCKIARMRYLKFLWGIVLLQGVVRGQRDRSECRKYHDAATCIQSSWRRSRTQMQYVMLRLAIVKIQTSIREAKIHACFSRKIDMVVNLQRVVRDTLVPNKCQK